MSEDRIRVLRAGFFVSLMGLAACGTGYREGAAAEAEAGSEVHGEAMVAIAKELHGSECTVFAMSDRCEALFAELTHEVTRCSGAPGCDDALGQSLEGEPDEVSAFVASAGFATAMKSLFQRPRRDPATGAILRDP